MKNKFAPIVFSLLLAIVISLLSDSQVKQVSAGTTDCVLGLHHGTLTTSETWCAADNPHLIDNNVTVPMGVTLTIEPGVVAKFYPGAGLDIKGSLIANGTATTGKQILLTSNLPSPGQGSWGGISTASGSTLQLSYFEMAYAGQWGGFDYASLNIRTSGATVSHGRIHDGLGTAVWLFNTGITPQFNDVEIDHYSGAGLYQNTISMNPGYQNIRLHDTATNGLLLPGGLIDLNITLDGSPAAFNGAPVYSQNGITIGNGKTLTITPGTKLEMLEGISVAASAVLDAEGTPTLPIIFTTYADPAVAGSWGGILAAAGSTLQLSYCELAYTGRPGYALGAVQIDTSNASMRNCRVHDGLGTGLYLQSPGITPQFNDVEIDHFTGAGIVQSEISMNPSFVNMRLHDNAANGLQLPYPGTTSINVTLDGSPAALNGAPIYMMYGFTVGAGTTLTITPGTILKSIEGISVAATATLVAEGTPDEPIVFTTYSVPPVPGSWVGISAAPGSTLRLSYCELAYGGRPGYWVGTLNIATSNATVRQCRIHDSLGHGIYIHGAHPFPLWNDVLTDIAEVAVVVDGSGQLEAMHTTLARNQVGVFVSSGSATLTNTIVANNTIGVQQVNDGSIALNYTLFDGNPTATYGTVTDTHPINGAAAFEADGYHLAAGSDAIDAGIDMGIHNDIDGDLRPLGSGPDLGADEYWDAAALDATATITAGGGGDLQFTDPQGNPTEVSVPPGAVSQDEVLDFKAIEPVAPPLTYRQTGHAFHLWGLRGDSLLPGLVFDKPVLITLHYSDADLAGLDRKTLRLWYWNGSAWSDAACGAYERHPSQNWLTVPVCHLSFFSFFAQPYRLVLPFIIRN